MRTRHPVAFVLALACASACATTMPESTNQLPAMGQSLPHVVTEVIGNAPKERLLPDGRSAPELHRIAYTSAFTKAERHHFLYLPAGYHSQPQKRWPLLVFLHGDGERGDGKAELDRLLKNGPLHEAVTKKRDLPFVIVAQQMPSHAEFIRLGAEATDLVFPGIERGLSRDVSRGDAGIPPAHPETLPRGWPHLEADVFAMMEQSIADHSIDESRLYLSGLSYGGYGTWHFAKRHPKRFAAFATVCGAGGEGGFEALANAQTPLWAFHGGLDPIVLVEWQVASVRALRKAGHKHNRMTVHETLDHDSWTRTYGGWDLYAWLLEHRRKSK